MIGRIIRIARSIVRGIINQIKQQVNMIQNMVTSPLRTIVSEVTGGMWKGDGADRFVNEMTSEVIPALTNIANVNMSFGNQIEKALDRMDQAEQTAKNLVNPLHDLFSKIF
jgi:uncharacterized protein YukE